VVLGAVSCPAGGSCVAVGYYIDTSGGYHGLIDTLSGGTWTAATVPAGGLDPAAAAQVVLHQVSCPAVGSCAVTGGYVDSSGHRQGLLASLADGTWTAVTAPTSALSPGPWTDPAPSFSSLSCAAAGSCVAVGYYLAVPDPGYATSAASGIAGIAADGPGFQLVSGKGAVTSYNAPGYGSHTGTLKAPVVGIAVNPATGGYLLATSAGNVYSFHAPFYGSEAGKSLPGPVTGIVADGAGYLLAGRDGSVYSFNAPFYGSAAGKKLPAPVVGITAAG